MHSTIGRPITSHEIFTAFAHFLSRHSKIKQLSLHQIPKPHTLSSTPAFRSPILPRLEFLQANPINIQWILREKRQLKGLGGVVICTEYPGHGSEFDWGALDQCLKAMIRNSMHDRGTDLGFFFDRKDGMEEWMRSHVDLGKKSAIHLFQQVLKMRLWCSHVVGVLDSGYVDLFMHWLNLFPQVTQLEVYDHPPCRKHSLWILRSARTYCPRLTKIVVHTLGEETLTLDTVI